MRAGLAARHRAQLPAHRPRRCAGPVTAAARDPTGRQRRQTAEQLPPASALGRTADSRRLATTSGSTAREAQLPPPAPAHQQDQQTSEPGAAASPFAGLQQRWAELPGRYKLVFATSMSFVICNMDKVNISVAIIPMAQDFGWSPTVAGLVQSSFFYGYLLSQIPGGYASSLLGGRTVLPAGVALWSAATAGVPLLAGTLPGLFLSRAAVGLGEGVAPSAATDVVARVIPTDQRSRAISFIFGGLHVGSLLGLLIAPLCIARFGWPSVFYLFGGFGLLWCAWWEKLVGDVAAAEPELAAALTGAIVPQGQQGEGGRQQGGTPRLGGAPAAAEGDAALVGHGGHGGVIDARAPVPWRAFLRNPALGALAYTHYCNNWFHYTMLAWMPTYFTDSLALDLGRAAQVSLLPPIAAIVASAIAGPSADALIARGVPVETVRKAAQCIAFLGPAACLFAACFIEGGSLSVVLVTLSLGLASFSLAGLYSNHADLSPRYASVLLGMTNTSGALPGIVGVATTGWLFDQTGSWGLSLFAPSIFFFLTGSAAYVIWGSATRQEFDAADPGAANQPFGWETALRSLLPAGSAASGGDAEAGAAEGERQAEARGGKGSGSKAKDE
ncbi:putative anion transporter chloroplastic isoform X1 [Micractinium conductrix]|uniref:Anion transporter chloroplastic isoform X1 n=1 Tax=Micractinium conductrix TaxID=554055 RepID=A0A2P6VQI0_9CHLO|nr:putative anion transporter chloroplastic isoform X1 [Micractinium conductrix]|eukprot:PSC76363.1 putative anion transporter chloroplastic isoform X1 [Micractinium conductrix]